MTAMGRRQLEWSVSIKNFSAARTSPVGRRWEKVIFKPITRKYQIAFTWANMVSGNQDPSYQSRDTGSWKLPRLAGTILILIKTQV